MCDTFDPSAPTPEMSINVSLGEFHRTHEAAYAAKKLIAEGMDKLSVSELNAVLAKLKAAELLNDAETGDDIPSIFYLDEIKLVEVELNARK